MRIIRSIYCHALRLAAYTKPPSRRFGLGIPSSVSREFTTGPALSIADAFERVLNDRNSLFDISPDPIDEKIVNRLLSMTITAPTSFNMQPYKIIIVHSDAHRLALSEAMTGGNAAKIRKSPLTAIFLADLNPLKSIDKLVALETGVRPESYLAILPSLAEAILGGQGKDPAAHKGDIKAWAYKNTALAAQTYMLSAAALGLRTCPMEGYESTEIAKVLKIPERYDIPLMIATGYSTRGATPKVRTRFPVHEICFCEEFGKKFDYN